MATTQASFNNGEDEDEEYIDMDASSLSSSKFLCYSINSPPQSREFEFQMCSLDANAPADELFYNGKLLPLHLHLHPRLQIVQNLAQKSKIEVPFEPNSVVSPLESCRASCELDSNDDRSFEWSAATSNDDSNKSWSKKLKQSSIITQKLKAYLKSLFRKSGCSDESCAKACKNVSKMNKQTRMAKNNVADLRRRSFSGVIRRHSYATNSSSVSSSSFSSSSSSSASFSLSSSGGYCDLQLLKRSNSANENSIEGAIAHCKQSQKLGVCSFSASKISVCGEQDRPQLCRI